MFCKFLVTAVVPGIKIQNQSLDLACQGELARWLFWACIGEYGKKVGKFDMIGGAKLCEQRIQKGFSSHFVHGLLAGRQSP